MMTKSNSLIHHSIRDTSELSDCGGCVYGSLPGPNDAPHILASDRLFTTLDDDVRPKPLAS